MRKLTVSLLFVGILFLLVFLYLQHKGLEHFATKQMYHYSYPAKHAVFYGAKINDKLYFNGVQCDYWAHNQQREIIGIVPYTLWVELQGLRLGFPEVEIEQLKNKGFVQVDVPASVPYSVWSLKSQPGFGRHYSVRLSVRDAKVGSLRIDVQFPLSESAAGVQEVDDVTMSFDGVTFLQLPLAEDALRRALGNPAEISATPLFP